MAKTLLTTFKLKRGNATDWETKNPVLAEGEPGFELDTGKLKIGNGVDNYNDLPYLAGDGGETIWEPGEGDYSVQLKGTGCAANADNSIAKGYVSKTLVDTDDATWQGAGSEAGGLFTNAKGAGARANGVSTNAIGRGASTDGDSTEALADCAHAEGIETAATNLSETAIGHQNLSNYNNDTYGDSLNTQFSVGIGQGHSLDPETGITTPNRKNAFEVMQNGDAYLYGVGGYDGTNVEAAQTLQDAIGSGGGGAQPDWEQNNPNAADYIKNRPFYEEAGEATVQEFSSEEVMIEDGILYLMSQTFIAPNAGETVSLYINEDTTPLVEGTFLSETINGIAVKYIGNLSLVGAGADTGETYLLLFMKEGGADIGMYISMEEIGIVNAAKVQSIPIEYHTLNEKFIPELTHYVKKTSTNEKSVAVGKNVFSDANSSKNIIANDNLTIVDYYNLDRWNTGIYCLTDGEAGVSGNIYLKDQANVFIGTPYQRHTYGHALSISDNIITINISDYLENIRYIDFKTDTLKPYFEDFLYDVYGQVENSEFEIEAFYPKDPINAKFYGPDGIDSLDYASRFNEILADLTERFNRYLDEQGESSLFVKLRSELYSVGGQGGIVIGVGAGISEEYGNCIVIGNGATSIGQEDGSGDNIVIGANASISGKHAITIGNYSNAGNFGIAIGEYAKAFNNNSVIIGHNVKDLDGEYLVNIANKIKVYTDNDFELNGINGIIINSSTHGSNQKFRITVDDSGTLTVKRHPDITPN